MRGGCKGFLLYIANDYPSTLNLYGVYLQAVTGNQYDFSDSVSLPPQIPYSIWHPASVSQSVTPTTLIQPYSQPYTSATYAAYTTPVQEIGFSQVMGFVILLWVAAIAVAVIALVYFLYLSKGRGKAKQARLDSLLTQKSPPQEPQKLPPQEAQKPSPQEPSRAITETSTLAKEKMFCFQCGAQISRASKFCKECGAKQE